MTITAFRIYFIEGRFTMDIITNVETVPSDSVLPAERKWAIRFDAAGTVTIVLGMRDYGRGWFSGYFAGLVTARLGIPFRRLRLYYSAALPAVLQTPVPPSTAFRRSHIGPVAAAAADIIEGMCDQVIERGRLAFAAMVGVEAVDIGFDQPTGRFFVLDRNRSGTFLEIAEATRGGSRFPCSSLVPRLASPHLRS
jgi:aerobic carbon-monoxide dehydrogenase large subunit